MPRTRHKKEILCTNVKSTFVEGMQLNSTKMLHDLKPPCAKCPYKLGLVQTLINPCPQCKENGYQTYERFQKQTSRDALISGEERE